MDNSNEMWNLSMIRKFQKDSEKGIVEVLKRKDWNLFNDYTKLFKIELQFYDYYFRIIFTEIVSGTMMR